MSQHYKIVNTRKREYLDPMDMLSGLSLGQIALPWSHGSMGLPLAGLSLLLASSCKGFPGDLLVSCEYSMIPGRWCGDTIVFAGDYDIDNPSSPGFGLHEETEQEPTPLEEMAALITEVRPYRNISRTVLAALSTDPRVNELMRQRIKPEEFDQLIEKMRKEAFRDW